MFQSNQKLNLSHIIGYLFDDGQCWSAFHPISCIFFFQICVLLCFVPFFLFRKEKLGENFSEIKVMELGWSPSALEYLHNTPQFLAKI